ncbi:uncharacterized protein LOC130744915 [Lotus japonicus]|uniref:uncharacterized protein LOC130744915 n=1 Tax=Lotus japonicus TaxID=34305 RepID=UPI0025827901|nr:uncharacterized protein LOC130744915 [Lotus japonicus]
MGQPPQQGMVKLSFRDQIQGMGAGGLVRDSMGKWIVGFYAHRSGGNALVAEAHGLLLCLELLWVRGHRNAVVEVDCEDRLTALDDEESCRFLPILNMIKSMRARSWNIVLTRIRRECNALADFLAKWGASASLVDICIVEDPPWDVETLVMRDLVLAP